MSKLFPKSVLYCSGIGTVGGGALILKDYVDKPKYEGNEKLKGKVVIITGATSGIGQATAQEMAEREARVIMACKDMKLCEQVRRDIVLNTHNKYVYCRSCDLASQESIRNFVQTFKKEHSQLHILINNAAVMACPKTLTNEGIELQLGVNHMGHFLLTNLLLDTLKASAPARIINLSTSAHKNAKIRINDLNFTDNYDPNQAYYQSKLANLLFTKELSQRLQGTGVTVNAVNPGVVDTNISRHLTIMKYKILKMFVYPFMWLMSKTPKGGAQTVLHAALDPSLINVSGAYFQDMQQTSVAEVVENQALLKWLWLVSEKWTNLQTNLQSNLQTNLQSNLQTNLQSNLQTNLQNDLQAKVQTSMEPNLQ